MLGTRTVLVALAFGLFLLGSEIRAQDKSLPAGAAPKSEVLDDPQFFPIAVWLQAPRNAAKYRDAGINLYVGLWQGPTEDQLTELKRHGMHVICSQNSVGLAHKDDPAIVAWMHGDEPDNAQALRGGKGYGPPLLPDKIVADYRRIHEADPSRPVLLNLGQGVAFDQYIGRGVRRNHPEDYAEYIKGSDIVSFDIYPVVHDHKDVAGKLWFVADGVSRLRKWSNDQKRVWNCIECTHIGNAKLKATPQQVKAEVWMSLVRGSRGLIYFVHQFEPKFVEAALLADPEMLLAVTEINKQIQTLAPVLNSPTVTDGVKVSSSTPDVQVEAIVKNHDGASYVFAVGMRDGKTTAHVQLAKHSGKETAEVLGERRTVEVTDGAFDDDFAPWDVHLYRIQDVAK